MPKGADKLSIYTGGSERMFLDLQTPKKRFLATRLIQRV